jgi:hypothetical protein
MTQGTYQRLGVGIDASWRTVVRRARLRILHRLRRDPKLREARKAYYRDILAFHQEAREQ